METEDDNENMKISTGSSWKEFTLEIEDTLFDEDKARQRLFSMQTVTYDLPNRSVVARKHHTTSFSITIEWISDNGEAIDRVFHTKSISDTVDMMGKIINKLTNLVAKKLH